MFVQGAPGVPGGLQPLPPMQQAAPAGFAAQPPAPYTDSAPQQNYMAQPPLPLPGALPPQRSLLESLDAQERLMDSRVLHVNTLSSVPMPSPPNAAISDLDQKQERFRKTVMAAHEIVTQKLYKAKAPSLEAYFKSVWKISRAQVYRFLDCATVLTVCN